MNKVIVSGRLTSDPEVRYTTGHEPVAVASYTLAVQRDFKNKDGEYDADFIRCKAFGKRGEFCERYLHKGMKILAEGRIQTGSYEDKNGQKVFTTDVIAQRVEFIDFKEKTSQNENQGFTDDTPQGFSSVSEDDIPF